MKNDVATAGAALTQDVPEGVKIVAEIFGKLEFLSQVGPDLCFVGTLSAVEPDKGGFHNSLYIFCGNH